MTLLTAIKTLEEACLSKDSTRTTSTELKAVGKRQAEGYLQWLRQQAPQTSMFIPEWDRLTNKPAKL